MSGVRIANLLFALAFTGDDEFMEDVEVNAEVAGIEDEAIEAAGDENEEVHPDEDQLEDEEHVQDRPVRNSQITPRQFYSYRLQVREIDDGHGGKKIDDVLTRWGRLFQEYCCMALAKAETQKLRFYRTHQKDLRADLYKGLRDAVKAHEHANDDSTLQVRAIVRISRISRGGECSNVADHFLADHFFADHLFADHLFADHFFADHFIASFIR